MGQITEFPIETVDSSLTGADVEASLNFADGLRKLKTPSEISKGIDNPDFNSAASKIYAEFSNKNNGPLVFADSGEEFLLTTNADPNSELQIIDGRVTYTSTGVTGNSAGHLLITGIEQKIKRIGAEFEMAQGTTDTGSLTLVLWSEPLIYPGPVVDSEMHISFSNKTWNIGRFVNQVYTSYGTGTYKEELQPDTLYKVEVVIDGTVIYIQLPDGSAISVNNPDINRVPLAVPDWEVFATDASTDWKAKIKSIWLDYASADPVGGPTRKNDLYSALINTINATLPSSSDYPPSSEGNVTFTIPETSEYIAPELDVEFVVPPSGRVLVELTARINVTSASVITWNLLINEAGYSGSRNLTSASYTGDEYHTAQFLVKELPVGTKCTAKWRHKKTGGGGTIRLNRDGFSVATAKVTPLS